jgi:muconolactone delta-isomerase
MRFMVTVHLEVPPERRSEMPTLLAAENAYVMAEIQRGHLECIYYAAGAPTVWAVIHADSLEAAQHQVEAYPLYSFMRLTYTPLR